MSLATQRYNILHILLIYLALAAVTLIAFQQVRLNDFVDYDDGEYVFENPQVNQGLSGKSVLWAFTTLHGQTSYWHPLTWISHMVDCQLYGLNPAGHHLTNLFLHILNTLLLFGVLKAMTRALWPSAFVAALFAIHPLHVESVAWVAERKDVLSGLFWLLTIAAYIRYTKQPRIGKYILMVLMCMFALMAKPMAVTLPFVLLLLDYWPLGRLQLRRKELKSLYRLIVEKIPLFILSAAICAVTWSAQKSLGALTLTDKVPLAGRIANSLVSYLGYIAKMFYPVKLAVLYPHPGNFLSIWKPVFALVILLVLTGITIYMFRKKSYLLVGWLWYLGMLVPVIGLVQTGPQAMANRYTYLPLVGIFIMVAWSINEISKRYRFRKTFLSILTVLVLLPLLLCTQRQAKHWQNSFTLFQYTLDVTEDNFIIHNNYGYALSEKGELEKAVYHYEESLRIEPRYTSALNNLAASQKKQGKLDTAIRNWKKVLEISPNHAEAHSNLALTMAQQGKYDQAIEHFNLALRKKPDSKSHYILGIIYYKLGKYDQALENYKNAVRLEPDNPVNHFHVALAYSAIGDVEKTIYHYNEALKLKPDYADALTNLGGVLKSQGKTGDAIEVWKKALEFQPGNPGIYLNIALAMNDLGKYDQAVKFAEKACQLTGFKNCTLLDTLVIAYAAVRDYNMAVEIAEKAIEICRSSGRENLAEDLQKRMELYRQKLP